MKVGWFATPTASDPTKGRQTTSLAIATEPAGSRADVAAYADCTQSQMMAMFGWTDPKMPAHFIAQANREKLGISGMEKIVTFDQSQSRDDCLPMSEENSAGTEW